jgi:hypothetical protein
MDSVAFHDRDCSYPFDLLEGIMTTLPEWTRRAVQWHRPMMVFAGVMAAMAVVSLGGLIFDDRILLGAPIGVSPILLLTIFLSPVGLVVFMVARTIRIRSRA